MDPALLSRRRAMQWVLAAVAASSLPARAGSVPTPSTNPVPLPNPSRIAPPANAATIKVPVPGGYGLDPKLLPTHKPGEYWPLILSDAQRKTVTALADVIFPKDEYGPAASELGIPAIIDEWVSAPYPTQLADRPVIIDGLGWLEAESGTRFKLGFAELSDAQKHAICDDICYHATAKPGLQKAVRFFSVFRNICAAAYYATPEGWKAIGYVGNTPLEKFDGPPAEVLAKLGVTQTVA